ncbi:MAG: ATP-binding protein [Solirubrobacteraceae bacterium]
MSFTGAVRAPARALAARLRRMPLRLKLVLAFAGAMVVLFGGLSLVVFARYEAGLDNGIAASLKARAADLSVVARLSDESLVTLRSLPPSSGGFAQILARDGRVLASTGGVAARPLLRGAALGRAWRGPVDSQLGQRAQMRAVPIAPVGGASPRLLVVGVSLATRNGALDTLQRWLYIGGPIALLLACAAGYMVAALALDPVEGMRRRVVAIRGLESDERLPLPPAHDEIRRLGETLNEMLERLEDVVARGRAFVAGASHELRTPLTILQLELDDALGEGRSYADLRAAAESAREEVRRLTSLTEDLLVIAQTDQRRLPLHTTRFDAHRAMRVVAERYAQLDGGSVTVEPGGPVYVVADVARLDQVLSNLVENALRFGAGAVVLRALPRGGVTELHVLDDGPGFAPEFLPHAFERFSQGDPARSLGGTGLGLAIVRAIVEAHGGAVSVDNRGSGGADVWLTLALDERSYSSVNAEASAGLASAARPSAPS